MDFNFAWLVELLNNLDLARLAKALPTARSSNTDNQIVNQWFSKYESKLDRQGKSGFSFLACIFPERLPERSYNIQEKRLSAIFGRALGLGSTRARTLNSWMDGSSDFASCVEAVMAECESDPPSPSHQVTLEEIDTALERIAANSPFSSAKLRQQATNISPDQLLAPILRRLSSCEAKWLVRMILKSFAPVQVPEQTTMLHFHFLLPSILSIQNSFDAAVRFLNQPSILGLPPNPDRHLISGLKKTVTKDLVPQVGTMIKRPHYAKARSIKHCCDMADKRLMSVERKYDGEYCQIHVDRSRGSDCVQIFSKSGKDSTTDRVRLHGAIKESLSLDREDCKIKQMCILEGELLVYNTTTQAIEPFHKIRRHVMHGRRFLGIEKDSQAAFDEQVMIMYFDVLLLDNKVLASHEHDIRRQHLKALVQKIPGVAEVCERELIAFDSRRASQQLREMFARSITLGWEGFLLKGCKDPYFSLHSVPRTIKLKKDYISALGDTVDLCIVGGRCDSTLIREFELDNVSWTTFYLACLENKAEVIRFGGKPRFKVIDTIDPHGIPRNDLLDLNVRGQFMRLKFASEMPELAVDIMATEMAPPTELFKHPIVVEIMGAGFDKNSGCNFFTVRFPRLTRIHLDRTFHETLAFSELQDAAKASLKRSPDADSQADARWVELLLAADGKSRYIIDKSQSTSPRKTPLSAATASLSPATRKRQPVRIHVDNGELSQKEAFSLRNRNPLVSPSPATEGPSRARSKRKISDLASSPTPTANSKGKIRKSCSGHKRLETFPGSQVSEHSLLSESRTLRTGLGLGNRSILRIVDGSPESLHASQGSTQMREPLFEIASGSPQLNRREAVLKIPIPPNEAGHPPKTIARKSRAKPGSDDGTATVNVPAKPPPDMPYLPAPPVSSAESAIAETRLVSAHAPVLKTMRRVAGMRRGTHLLPARKPDSVRLFHSTILLGGSLRHEERRDEDMEKIYHLLRQCDMSFTYSTTCFSRHVFQNVNLPHLVLVNEGQSTDVAHEILEVGLKLVNASDIGVIQESVAVVFVDYSTFLDRTAWSNEHRIKLGQLEACVCGCLELGPNITDDRGNMAARVIWDWDQIAEHLFRASVSE